MTLPPGRWSARALELVKKFDVERRTRRTRRKTLSIFLCGFRGFCVVRDLFTPSLAEREGRGPEDLRIRRPLRVERAIHHIRVDEAECPMIERRRHGADD